MKKTAVFLISSACTLACTNARPAGFPDQGFLIAPVVRTDYAATDEGTAANPLTLGPICLFGGCPSGPTVYSQSNYWSQNYSASICQTLGCTYWILGMNNEIAFNSANPGPPNASLPRVPPGQGIMGFTTLFGNENFIGDTLWRAHLVLNVSSSFNNPAPGATPFLSLGAFTGHGANGNLGVLNPSSSSALSVISFGTRLWGYTNPIPRFLGQDATLASNLFIIAKWGTKPKMVFLTFFHSNIENSSPTNTSLLQNWNWNIQESSYYPGAEYVAIDAEDVLPICGYNIPRLTIIGQDLTYRINPTALFACLRDKFSEPFPTAADIPITGVVWSNEATGKDGNVWTDVHQMKMLTAAQASSSDEPDKSEPASVEYGIQTKEIAEAIEEDCALKPDCAERMLEAYGNQP